MCLARFCPFGVVSHIKIMSFFGVIKSIFNGSSKSEASSPPSGSPPVLNEAQTFVMEQAATMMKQVNESVQLAHNSINPETKVSRLEFAKSKLQAMQILAAEHPFVKLTNLESVQTMLQKFTEEFSAAGYYALTDESCRDYQQDVWRGINMPADDLVKGFRFGATMQLRTPLRVLSRHGEVHHGNGDPPMIAQETWEGYWLPVLKSNKELGIDVPEVIWDGTMASDVGQIPRDGGDYLKFLLAVRGIVEDAGSVAARMDALRLEIKPPKWTEFCIRLGGKEHIYNSFFPAFLACIPKLPRDSVELLWEAGLTTPAKLAATPDAILRGIKGIGPAKLKIIRDACEAMADKDAELLDIVTR